MIEDVLERLAENISARHYGKHRGTVKDNKDPKGLGRIKAVVPQLLADEEIGWALPCLPYGGSKDNGLFLIPEIGSNVWIEFESGDLSYPIWSGVWWGESSGSEIPAESQNDNPQVKILKTKSGNTVELHDMPGQEKVLLTHKSGHKIQLDETGITISSHDGKNSIKLDLQGIHLTRGTNSIDISDTSVNVNNGALEVI